MILRNARPPCPDPRPRGLPTKHCASEPRAGRHCDRLEALSTARSPPPCSGKRPLARIPVSCHDRRPQVEHLHLPAVGGDRPLDDRAFLEVEAVAPGRFTERRDLSERELAPPCGQARLAKAIESERLVDGADARSVEDQAQPEIPVRRPEDRFVEPSVLEETVAPYGGMSEDEVALQDGTTLIVDLEAPAPIVVSPHSSPVGNEVGVGRKDVQVGTELCELG